ncbi:MAG: MarR family transcriptional regulator [Alphaproteobacteria bacterium]
MAHALARKADAFGDATLMPDAALDRLLGYNLKRVYMLARADFRETMGDEGLSPRAFSVLSLVVEAPGITQSDVARTLGIERSGLVAIVDELEKSGYLRRVPVPDDRRLQALQPTGEGRATFAKLLAGIRAHETRLFAMLTEAERDTLLDLLLKIREAAEEQP